MLQFSLWDANESSANFNHSPLPPRASYLLVYQLRHDVKRGPEVTCVLTSERNRIMAKCSTVGGLLTVAHCRRYVSRNAS